MKQPHSKEYKPFYQQNNKSNDESFSFIPTMLSNEQHDSNSSQDNTYPLAWKIITVTLLITSYIFIIVLFVLVGNTNETSSNNSQVINTGKLYVEFILIFDFTD